MTLLPNMMRKLAIMGENIELARLRRRFTSEIVAERAGISLEVLNLIEAGEPTVSLGEYLCVMRTLNLENDIFKIAENDILGGKLQDIELLNKNNGII